MQNPLDTDLVISFVQSNAGENNETFAFFAQPFDNFVVPARGTANSGTIENVLLTQGAVAALAIIPDEKLDIQAAATVQVGQGGYTIPWLQLVQFDVPTTYTLDLTEAAMKAAALSISASSASASSSASVSAASSSVEVSTTASAETTASAKDTSSAAQDTQSAASAANTQPAATAAATSEAKATETQATEAQATAAPADTTKAQATEAPANTPPATDLVRMHHSPLSVS